MLSAETGVGRHPVEAVEVMSIVAAAAEESPVIHGRARAAELQEVTSAGAVMHAAVVLAEALDARVLVVPTTTGGAARDCAKFRPGTRIVALAHDPVVADQLTLEWGVQPLAVDVGGSPKELIDAALGIARKLGSLVSGDRVVLTAGPRTFASGATNAIVVRELP
jgi:pyruvate kinase